VTADQQLLDDIANRFGFHPATAQTGPMHDEVRDAFAALARYVASSVPSGRHQALALTALQESMMWANAAIACDTVPEQPPVKGKAPAVRRPPTP
jgi:hypothetical protein